MQPINSTNWLSESLKREIRNVFEPRYYRQLSDDEVADIADNLANFVESVLKFKCNQKYETQKKN